MAGQVGATYKNFCRCPRLSKPNTKRPLRQTPEGALKSYPGGAVLSWAEKSGILEKKPAVQPVIAGVQPKCGCNVATFFIP